MSRVIPNPLTAASIAASFVVTVNRGLIRNVFSPLSLVLNRQPIALFPALDVMIVCSSSSSGCCGSLCCLS